MDVTSKIGTTYLTIMLDGILHLSLKRELLYGIQAWKNSTHNYEIEYHFKGQPSIHSQYDDKETFLNVLKELNKLDIMSLD